MVKQYLSKTGNKINVCSYLPSARYTLLRITNASALWKPHATWSTIH